MTNRCQILSVATVSEACWSQRLLAYPLFGRTYGTPDVPREESSCAARQPDPTAFEPPRTTRWLAARRTSTLLLMAAWLAESAAAPIDCWVDLFNGADFKGRQERIYGPVELANLKSVRGFDWNDVIESIAAGPGAEVTLYRREDFSVPETPPNHVPELEAWGFEEGNYRNGVLTLSPGQRIHHLGEYQLHQQVSSLKLVCQH